MCTVVGSTSLQKRSVHKLGLDFLQWLHIIHPGLKF